MGCHKITKNEIPIQNVNKVFFFLALIGIGIGAKEKGAVIINKSPISWSEVVTTAAKTPAAARHEIAFRTIKIN